MESDQHPNEWVDTTLLHLGIFHEWARPFTLDLTRDAVTLYQRKSGLDADGICGPNTRGALRADMIVRSSLALPMFRGSLGLIVQWEGHAGRPYWPAQASGVTLDPGFDLQWHDLEELRDVYGGILDEDEIDDLSIACGAGPLLARELIHDPRISKIRIDRESAAELLPKICPAYWIAVTRLVPAAVSAPPAVQSALLSYCYNVGPGRLHVIAKSVAARAWSSVALGLTADPRNPKRRLAEAQLILAG